MKSILLVTLILSLVSFVLGDLYMQNPRGSNDRFNEQNQNRNNANRNFDSQNNAKGGYAVGESSTQAGQPTVKPMYYFEGSLLQLEWTNQHGCGVDSPDTFCEIIIQYMCDNDYKQYNGAPWAMTDGDQTGNGANPPSTGRQEPDAWWDKCQTRQRNVGLWIADRNLNGDTARYTRQNNNGDRYGNECAEERDYYPYWHPNPFKDIAILTSVPERCEYYVANSQNQNMKYECECANWATTGCGTGNSCWRFNNQTACQAGTDTNTNTQCQWVGKNHKNLFSPVSDAEEDIGAPDCQPAPFTRPNQNGNGVNGETPSYMWTVPTTDVACGNAAGDCGNCFLRYRYNITPSDFDNLQSWQHSVDGFSGSYWDVDSRFNGDRSILMDGAGNYFENDPTVDVGVSGGLALAHNTAQTSRVFQDRTYMFEIRKRPAEYLGKTIYNINVRGKRGNIVQTYPATEYDFVPTNLKIKYGEYVHFQWVGSNNNPQGNDGQGQAGSDRSNLMQFKSLNSNYPLPVGEVTMFNDVSLIRAYATSGYGLGVDENLNTASPYFDGYAAAGNQLLLLQPGYYAYGSTRNNNFTNRTQKGSIFVQEVTGSKIVTPNKQ